MCHALQALNRRTRQGISQCLITVRLGLASAPSFERPSSRHTQTIGGSGGSKGIVVSIEQSVSSDHGSSDLEKAERLSDSESERSSVSEV